MPIFVKRIKGLLLLKPSFNQTIGFVCIQFCRICCDIKIIVETIVRQLLNSFGCFVEKIVVYFIWITGWDHHLWSQITHPNEQNECSSWGQRVFQRIPKKVRKCRIFAKGCQTSQLDLQKRRMEDSFRWVYRFDTHLKQLSCLPCVPCLESKDQSFEQTFDKLFLFNWLGFTFHLFWGQNIFCPIFAFL